MEASTKHFLQDISWVGQYVVLRTNTSYRDELESGNSRNQFAPPNDEWVGRGLPGVMASSGTSSTCVSPPGGVSMTSVTSAFVPSGPMSTAPPRWISVIVGLPLDWGLLHGLVIGLGCSGGCSVFIVGGGSERYPVSSRNIAFARKAK